MYRNLGFALDQIGQLGARIQDSAALVRHAGGCLLFALLVHSGRVAIVVIMLRNR